MSGIELIAQERKEQIEKHYRTLEADKAFNSQPTGYREMTPLTLQASRLLDSSLLWRVEHWNREITDKMEGKPYKERLIIAGALIAAEIDRINDKI